MNEESNIKRYNLKLSLEMFDALDLIAKQEATSMLVVIQRFLRLGILLYQATRAGKQIVIRDGKEEKEVILL